RMPATAAAAIPRRLAMPMRFIPTHSSRSPPNRRLVDRNMGPDPRGSSRPRMKSSLIGAACLPPTDASAKVKSYFTSATLRSYAHALSLTRRRGAEFSSTSRFRSVGNAPAGALAHPTITSIWRWVTQQQGDTDRYNLQAQQQAVQAAQRSTEATQAQLRYYNQQKMYQQVVAPFDGVITQRNIDVGSLITADATGGTSMFSMTHSDVIRVWAYVPQDSAFGVKPGVEAVIRVPAMPHLTLHGQ